MRLFSLLGRKLGAVSVPAETAIVFSVSLAVLALVQLPGRYPDADAFYHAKMAILSLDGPVRDFSWLPFTVLTRHFADHHYLYHLIISPFVYWGGVGWGLKSVTVALGAAAVSCFHLLLRRLGARHAWLFSFLFLTSGPMLQRFSLVKATALSLLVLFGVLWAVRRNRRGVLFALAFVYVWSYGGWPILVAVAFLDVASTALVGRGGRSWNRGFRQSGLNAEEVKSSLLRFFAVHCGLTAGLVVNPFFPGNVFFYWEQVMQVAVIGHAVSVAPGIEWLPFTPLDVFRNVSVVIIAWAVFGAVILSAVFWPSVRRRAEVSFGERRFMILSCLFALLTLVMTLMNRRHVEYLVPTALIALAVTSSLELRRLDYRKTVDLFGGILAHRRMVSALPFVFAAFLALMSLRSVAANLDIQRGGYPVGYLSRIGEQIQRTVPPGTVIFNAAWEDFPALFLAGDNYSYVSGLDPNFLSRSDESLHELYSGLAWGRFREDAAKMIREEFKANFAVIPAGHPLGSWLSGDEQAWLLYADEEAELWFLGE